jgi:cytochrome P450
VTAATHESPAFRPAAPPRPRGRLPLLRFLRTVRDNTIATWPEAAFDLDFMERRLLFRRTVVANSPATIKHVLLDNADNYVKSVIARRLLSPGLGNGLLTAEGADWRRQRRIMAPAFQHKRIEGFAPTMNAAAQAMLARWDALPAGAGLDIAEAMMRVTLTIIARTMFSTESEDEIAAVGDAVSAYQLSVRPGMADLIGLPEWLPRRGASAGARALRGLDSLFNAIIERRRRGGGPHDDLLALLLAARDDETGSGLSDAELRDEVATIFTAGHETTANALAWTWYLLSGHPAVEARLHEELARVLGGRAPGFADIPALGFTRAVIDEAMRLYPPAHTLSREALADDEIAGHRIAAGTAVIISPWVMHRHRAHWRDADSFDPDRFGPGGDAPRERFVYMPFGGGPRICIGASFALTEAVLIVAAVAQRYRLRLKPGHPVEPVGLITLRPRYGLPMTLERRR